MYVLYIRRIRKAVLSCYASIYRIICIVLKKANIDVKVLLPLVVYE